MAKGIRLTPDELLRTLGWIANFINQKHLGPTIREVQLGLGLNSPRGAHLRAKALEYQGWITREPGTSRGLLLTIEGRDVLAKESTRGPTGNSPSEAETGPQQGTSGSDKHFAEPDRGVTDAILTALGSPPVDFAFMPHDLNELTGTNYDLDEDALYFRFPSGRLRVFGIRQRVPERFRNALLGQVERVEQAGRSIWVKANVAEFAEVLSDSRNFRYEKDNNRLFLCFVDGELLMVGNEHRNTLEFGSGHNIYGVPPRIARALQALPRQPGPHSALRGVVNIALARNDSSNRRH